MAGALYSSIYAKLDYIILLENPTESNLGF